MKESISKEEVSFRLSRAKGAFDTISLATYYGFAFREACVNNPELLEAAEKLAEQIKKHPALVR